MYEVDCCWYQAVPELLTVFYCTSKANQLKNYKIMELQIMAKISGMDTHGTQYQYKYQDILQSCEVEKLKAVLFSGEKIW